MMVILTPIVLMVVGIPGQGFIIMSRNVDIVLDTAECPPFLDYGNISIIDLIQFTTV